MFTAEAISRKSGGKCRFNSNIPMFRAKLRALQRSEQSFNAAGGTKDRLADNFDKIIKSQDIHPQDEVAGKSASGRTVAEIEEHILRCLGAAVIMQWNTIPTKLQREWFDTAGSLGDVLQTAALRGQIARFLHDHKDEENPADGISKPNMTKGEPRGA